MRVCKLLSAFHTFALTTFPPSEALFHFVMSGVAERASDRSHPTHANINNNLLIPLKRNYLIGRYLKGPVRKIWLHL